MTLTHREHQRAADPDRREEDSEYAEEHEAEVIDAAMSAALDTYVDQREERLALDNESDAGAPDTDPAHLESAGEENDHGQ